MGNILQSLGAEIVNNGRSVLNDPETKQFLQEIVGDEGLDVVVSLLDREATDEEIAEETDLKLNIVRKILYKLYDYRLASYTRTKDREIGWYTYTWKLDLDRASDVIITRKKSILEELTKKLEFETNHVFFCCKKDNSKVPFSVATEYDFKCPQCHEVLAFVDNQKTITGLEREINRLKKEIRHD
jgi:transcription initiation factor TFIIE subunit alpha